MTEKALSQSHFTPHPHPHPFTLEKFSNIYGALHYETNDNGIFGLHNNNNNNNNDDDDDNDDNNNKKKKKKIEEEE